MPASRRDAIRALWSLDAALAAIVSGASQPALAQIKLAWWREAIAALDKAPPPPEPLLLAISEHLIPAGIASEELGRLADGWEHLLGLEPLQPTEIQAYAAERGGRLFALSAALLDPGDRAAVTNAGEAWALLDLARHSSDAAEIALALDAGRSRLASLQGHRWPVPLRPLGMLSVLAQRDADKGLSPFEVQGAPGRMMRMIRHRLTGR